MVTAGAAVHTARATDSTVNSEEMLADQRCLEEVGDRRRDLDTHSESNCGDLFEEGTTRRVISTGRRWEGEPEESRRWENGEGRGTGGKQGQEEERGG